MQRPEEILLTEKLQLSLEDEMHLENAFLSALLILQVWWYFKICSDIAGISNKNFLFLTSFLPNTSPVNYFTWSVNLHVYCKANRSQKEEKNEEAEKVQCIESNLRKKFGKAMYLTAYEAYCVYIKIS